jgi:hypothetical protein
MAVISGDLFSNAAADGILLRHLGFANVDALWFKELVEYWANGFDWRRFTARYHEGEMICHWFSPYDGGSTTPSFAKKEATFSPSGMMARTFNDSVFASVMAQLFLACS